MTEKRLKCPICDYLMRVLDETDEGYLCYCVKCNKERYVDKYSFKQFLIDIEQGKEIEENLLIDLFQEQESKIEKLNNKNEWLKKEMEKLKAQLLYTDSVCDICNYHYLMRRNDGYYLSRCKKGHEECSKTDLNYCEDFELVEDYE